MKNSINYYSYQVLIKIFISLNCQVENEDIEKYEKVEIKVRSDLDAMMKIQDFLDKDEYALN